MSKEDVITLTYNTVTLSKKEQNAKDVLLAELRKTEGIELVSFSDSATEAVLTLEVAKTIDDIWMIVKPLATQVGVFHLYSDKE